MANAINTTVVDTRGLSCPIPVIMTREALASLQVGARLEILVDEAVAKENVSRLLRSNRLQPEVQTTADGWRIAVVK
jgi:TusA-related sulfurtransferase